MKLLNNESFEENNYIAGEMQEGHIIKKYEFRNIEKEPELVNAIEEKGIYTPPAPQQVPEIDNEKLEELLKGQKLLEEKILALSTQIEAQNQGEGKELEAVRQSAYQQGLLEGEQKAKEKMQIEQDHQEQRVVLALQELDQHLAAIKTRITEIEKDLSVIALDIAKEVILQEVQERHQEIALTLAKELLAPVAENITVTLRVNPLDLNHLQERIEGTRQVEFVADPSVGKGGVVINSAYANFDGSILSRYKHLKQSLLDEKGL
ncbi:hypothetical protein BBW65_00355 [Helicobacter enhydrae]|uniref:Flagellar assembly protein FliH n=1 Tax=Helicobacter enhydrae TaxID=222136 RepID=A0A1B1U3U5_9HELI|nr:FliH/SctL family protein [Helicobacter enhydrae]ANV97365.1 hypothetical protein BBW65_00355 [Helicobacter enhydrae]